MRLLFYLSLLYAFPVMASDFFLIKDALKEDIKQINPELDLPVNPHHYDTPLGITSRCYEGKTYLILSKNDFGSGYEFTRRKPRNVICMKVAEMLSITNKAGMKLGMAKEKVLERLLVPQTTDKATLLYNQKVTLKNREFDEQSWVDIEFSNNKLDRLSVFVSLTN